MPKSVPLLVVSLLVLLVTASFAETGGAEAFLKNYFRLREQMHPIYSGQAGKPVVEERHSNNTELEGNYRPDSGDIFTDLYVSGNYVYLGNAFEGLRVIDVSNPADPLEIASFPRRTTGVFRLVSGEIHSIATGAPLAFPTGVAFHRKENSLFIADFGALPWRYLLKDLEKRRALS